MGMGMGERAGEWEWEAGSVLILRKATATDSRTKAGVLAVALGDPS